MPLQKTYTDDQCEVTFSIRLNDPDIRSVTLVAEFNYWDRESLPLERDGKRWYITKTLATGDSYQYRYLIDGEEWRNDPDADRYVAHPYGGENSVVET